jgi:hypothetical protein
MKTFRSIIPAAALAAFAAGTAGGSLGREAPTVPDGIKALFASHCAGCHKGAFAPRHLKLGPDALPESVVSVPSKGKPDLELVVPGSPETSYLVMKVRGAEGISGKRMPPPRKTPLTAEEIGLIEEWIKGLK